MKNSKLLTILEASYLLGVSESTLRRWETEDKLIPYERTKGNQRRYKLSSLRPEIKREQGCIRQTIAYARVSSHEQKSDFERQKQLLELYCVSSGNVKQDLKLSDRIYQCKERGLGIDRVLNASINLERLEKRIKIPQVLREFTTVEMTALLTRNGLVSSIVEAVNKHQSNLIVSMGG